MKIKSPLQSGVALVIVLGFLVLISVLVVAFFSSVTTELKSSRNFSSNVTTRQLAESATQVVMGQIRAATSLENAAWASQPGMIRTYRTSAAVPGPEADTFFKLYSSNKMTVNGVSDLRDALDPNRPDFDRDWNTKPALWVDLNSPVLVKNPQVNSDHPGTTIPRFPIIDPRAYAKRVESRFMTLDSTLDPEHVNTEGFWYGAESGSDPVPTGVVEPSAGQATANDNQRLPMPVRWVYVLQDGTLTSPNEDATGGGDSTGLMAKWTNSQAEAYRVPSKANPIVGRIAFWTDDETSKVNLNTAGGYVDPSVDPNLGTAGYNLDRYAGSYWDTPRFYTEFDRGMPYRESLYKSGSDKMGRPMPGGGGLAICQLLQGEYQRYPGHPMTTSLGIVLGPYLKVQSGGTSDNPYLRSEAMYTILPRLGTSSRVGGGGAQGSTKGGIIRIVPYNPLVSPNTTPENLQINPKGDRLYGSVDELYYYADSPLDPTNASYKRQKNSDWLQSSPNPLVGGAETLTPEQLDRLRFFLTTQSRAPELNLFGRPRVTVWPVRSETGTETPSGLNPFDNVILFCSTIGVETNAATSGRPNTVKAPSASQSPLQTGLPSPASTGPPYRYIFTRREVPANVSALAGVTKDIDLPRNRQLMVYLQQLTALPIPGFGSSILAKLGNNNNRDQLLTEIFDYIRCANLQDTTTKTIGGVVAQPTQFTPKGLVLPSKPTYLQAGKTFSGFGRVPTVSEVTVVFYYAGPKVTAGKVDVDANGYPTHRKVRSFVLLSTFNPMQGYGPTKDPGQNDPKVSFQVTGLDGFKADIGGGGLSMGYPTTATTTCYRSSGGTWGGRNFGGFEGFMHTLVGQNTTWAPHKIKADSGNLLLTPFSDIAQGAAKTASGLNQQEYYQLQGANTIEVPAAMTTFNFISTNDVVIKTLYGGVQYQEIKLTFPAGSGWPVPRGDPGSVANLKSDFKNGATPLDYTDMVANPWIKLLPAYGPKAPAFIAEMNKYYWTDANGFYSPTEHGGTAPTPNYKFQNSLEAAWSFASRLAWSLQNSYNPMKDTAGNNVLNWYPNRWRAILQPGDTVKSMISCAAFGDTSSGDLRLMLTPPPTGSQQITAGWAPHPDYNTNSSRACMLRLADGTQYFPLGTSAVVLPPGGEATFAAHIKGATGSGNFPPNTALGNLPKTAGRGTVSSVVRDDGGRGDFDTGIGNLPDGPYLNKQDEGNVIFAYKDEATQEWRFPTPYFSTWAYESPGNTFTSPSRQMPSPGMMGSLPRRPLDGKGWETLCFRPDMGPSSDNHPGNAGVVKDHLLLDLFQMPVVEPYPISEPFSTAGKVNLNYQIQPFTYITRSTALRAALHPTRVTAGSASAWYTKYKNGEANSKNNVVDNSSNAADQYDVDKGQNHPIPENFRKVLDRDYTIKGFDTFFAQSQTDPSAGFFKSASQICERYLYPIREGLTTDSGVRNWWATKDLGGDNTLEKPYVDLYPRVTTKSNTYTVHMRVQTLRQIPRANSDDYARWDEGRDNILGEYRGATTIERYIDPADPRFDPSPSNTANFVNPDNTTGPNLESIYRFRAVINKKFAPF